MGWNVRECNRHIDLDNHVFRAGHWNVSDVIQPSEVVGVEMFMLNRGGLLCLYRHYQ